MLSNVNLSILIGWFFFSDAARALIDMRDVYCLRTSIKAANNYFILKVNKKTNKFNRFSMYEYKISSKLYGL